MFSLSKKTREFDALKASITCALSNRIVYTIDGIAMLLRVFLSFDHAKISSVVSVKKPVCLFSHAYTQTRCQSRRCKRIVRTKMSIDTLRSIVKKRERERWKQIEELFFKRFCIPFVEHVTAIHVSSNRATCQASSWKEKSSVSCSISAHFILASTTKRDSSRKIHLRPIKRT